MINKQVLVGLALAVGAVAPVALAQDRSGQGAPQAGFYGGVALRGAGGESAGISLSHLASTWGRVASPVGDDAARRALVFGGYRWSNDIAVEGSLSTADRYARRPLDCATPRG